MKSLTSVILSAVLVMSAGPVLAHNHDEERPDHFKGKQSETLQQAVANFSEYNKKLKATLAGEITPLAMVEIHELTYTLENALEKIHKEAAALKDVLEELHVASEHMDADGVKSHGKQYLKTAEALVK